MEIVTSKYRHPEIKSGQHVNGPESIFVRENESSDWHLVHDIRSQYAVRKLVEKIGLRMFLGKFCTRVL